MFSQLGHNHCPRIRRYSTQKFAHEIQRVQAQTYMGKCWIGAIARAPSQWSGGNLERMGGWRNFAIVESKFLQKWWTFKMLLKYSFFKECKAAPSCCDPSWIRHPDNATIGTFNFLLKL